MFANYQVLFAEEIRNNRRRENKKKAIRKRCPYFKGVQIVDVKFFEMVFEDEKQQVLLQVGAAAADDALEIAEQANSASCSYQQKFHVG